MSVSRRGLDRAIFKKYSNVAVKAGVLKSATYPADMLTDARTGEEVPDNRAGMKVATIAYALHYGYGQHHPRPFIAQAVAKHQKEWAKAVVTLAAKGMEPEMAVATVGQIMKEDIQEAIREWPADNSASWAGFKGFNHGLILTGHLQNSIESEMVKDGEQ
jgi:hypothetical protein